MSILTLVLDQHPFPRFLPSCGSNASVEALGIQSTLPLSFTAGLLKCGGHKEAGFTKKTQTNHKNPPHSQEHSTQATISSDIPWDLRNLGFGGQFQCIHYKQRLNSRIIPDLLELCNASLPLFRP